MNHTETPLSLYIHFPWCTKKCPYCDFNSHNKPETIDESSYISALLDDIKYQSRYIQERAIKTIFIGGGTPSLFSPNKLNHLLTNIIDHFPTSHDIEITMEANPGSLTLRYLKELYTTPINRLSIGVQSFQQKFLTGLGRIHNPQQAHTAIQGAIDAGFNRINIDLMYGLPEQTTQDALLDLTTAMQYNLQHLSWYQLTIEPNTYFYKYPPAQPNHDNLFEMQEQGKQLLRKFGFEQYEISAYQKQQQHCRHNLNYWQFGDYIGIGAGAHSKITTKEGKQFRYWNIKHPKHYLQAQNNYQAQIASISQKDMPGEFMMNALRLNQAVQFDLFSKRTGLAITALQPTLDKLASRKLITYNKHSLTLTELGYRFCDDVIAEFMA